jgi:hypothetical protein
MSGWGGLQSSKDGRRPHANSRRFRPRETAMVLSWWQHSRSRSSLMRCRTISAWVREFSSRSAWRSDARPCVATTSPQTVRVLRAHGRSDNVAFAFEAKTSRRTSKAVPRIVIVSTALGGCSIHGAPSFVLLGAFFPAWMLCALVGIAAGIAARVVFIVVGLDSILQFRLLVCVSVGLVVAALTWFFWFGQ